MSQLGEFTPDNLLIGGDVVTSDGTILSGEGELSRGAVLGKVKLGAASKAAKSGGNTGDGTLTLDSTTPILAGAKAGVYTVRVIRAAIDAIGATSPAIDALAELRDPNGSVCAVVDVPTTPGVTVSNQVKFALVEGNTAFALGDGFDITIAAGSGKLKLLDKTAVDGSADFNSILAEDVDATSADVAHAPIYLGGEFNSNSVTLADGTVVADIADAARSLGVHFKAALAN